MVIDVYYPNDDPPEEHYRPPESVFDDVDNYLADNTANGEKLFTLYNIAEQMGIDAERLAAIKSDPEFVDGLERWINVQEKDVYQDFNNRADVVFIALLIKDIVDKDNK